MATGLSVGGDEHGVGVAREARFEDHRAHFVEDSVGDVPVGLQEVRHLGRDRVDVAHVQVFPRFHVQVVVELLFVSAAGVRVQEGHVGREAAVLAVEVVGVEDRLQIPEGVSHLYVRECGCE